MTSEKIERIMNECCEEWRPIEGYSKYEISSLGRVRNVKYPERMLRPFNNGENKYRIVRIMTDDGRKKNFRVHRLVAQAFLPEWNEALQVNHKDENVENNCLNNLEMMTSKQNNNYGTRNQRVCEKSTQHHIKCVETGEVFISTTQASRAKGSNSMFFYAIDNPNKTSLGYHWVRTEEPVSVMEYYQRLV